MICVKPFRKLTQEFGCGQCLPCRINRRRKWVARMMLELLATQSGLFVTLTYDEQHLPKDGSLDKRHVQLFLKRLRYYLGVDKVRFYAVGEYGDKSWRPHYHLILFGVNYTHKALIEKSWTKGLIHVGTAEPDSMQYVAGYVTKKMTNSKDSRLLGRLPEFGLMSRRPGIGHSAIESFAHSIEIQPGATASLKAGWVPDTFAVGRTKYPMDRFVKSKLYSRLNVSKSQIQEKNRSLNEKQWAIKVLTSTDEYEKIRRGRVEQQNGRIGLERKKPL